MLNKENILFAIIGVLAGVIAGFVFASSINNSAVQQTTAGAISDNSNMPAGHPNVPGGLGGQMSPEVQAAIDTAKKEPQNFEAQLKAAEFYYQIQQYDGAIEFLTNANKIKPDHYEVIVHLGNAYFDSKNYDEARKWYGNAIEKKTDDVAVRSDFGLTFLLSAKPDYNRAVAELTKALEIDANHIQTVQNLTVAYTKLGDAEKAGATLAKLKKLDPTNTSLSQLGEDIKKIGS